MASVNFLYSADKRAIVHCSANATITIAGNSSQSNIATSTQNLSGATISKIWYGSGSSGYWNIKRGANVVATVINSGQLLFDGAPISVDKTGTLVLELVGTANGFIMVELHKEGTL